MTKFYLLAPLFILANLLPVSCGLSVAAPESATAKTDTQFKDYWFQGEAEISSYDLQQARYGEIRNGKAVMVFVTEDFSQKKQVKLDRPTAAGSDAVKVMKLNLTKKFNTGIYPYSMMQSVFTPIAVQENPHSLKVTTSSQEWCGHTFTQLNLQPNHFGVQSFSYFESEGDQKDKLDKVLLEDELWNRIRIAPAELPTGNFQIIPGTMAQRLRHSQMEAVKVTASLSSASDGQQIYELQYGGEKRNLRIYFDKAFPHIIQGWEETYSSGFGPNAKTLTTMATLDKTILSAYWSKNSNADAYLRDELNLDF